MKLTLSKPTKSAGQNIPVLYPTAFSVDRRRRPLRAASEAGRIARAAVLEVLG